MCVTGTSLAYYLSHAKMIWTFEKARSDMLTACFLLGIAPAERSGRGPKLPALPEKRNGRNCVLGVPGHFARWRSRALISTKSGRGEGGNAKRGRAFQEYNASDARKLAETHNRSSSFRHTACASWSDTRSMIYIYAHT